MLQGLGSHVDALHVIGGNVSPVKRLGVKEEVQFPKLASRQLENNVLKKVKRKTFKG